MVLHCGGQYFSIRVRSQEPESRSLRNGGVEPPRHEDTKEAIVLGLDHSSSLVEDAMFFVCF